MRADARIATRKHLASLAIACEIHDRRAQARALEGLAGVTSMHDDPHTTGLLLGAASALRDIGTLLGTCRRLASADRRPVAVNRAFRHRPRHRPNHYRAAVDAGFATGLRDPDLILTQVRSDRLALN